MSGAINMAIDDALLSSVAEELSPPVLRLYRWQPATLSLGYAQSVDSGVDLCACKEAGVSVVRRPTGGRAVLHDREVTYAVIAPVGPPFGSSVTESYRLIAGLLRTALLNCGLSAELAPGHSRGQQGQAICFSAAAQYELSIAGCKIAGCAQKRRSNAFLQHGSIPLELDLDLMGRIMPEATTPQKHSRFKSVGWLQKFSEQPLSITVVEDAMITAFQSMLGIEFESSCLSALEQSRSEKLCETYYGNADWTRSGPSRHQPNGN